MNNEKLKKQIEEINQRVEAGETVGITLKGEEKSARLNVNSDGARRRKVSLEAPPAGAGGKEMGINETMTAEENIHLDLDAAGNISDAQITKKIKRAVKLSQKKVGITGEAAAVAADLPRVVLTRDEARQVWILFQQCSYQTAGHRITAPAGYETDLSSIPRVFWSILAPEELSLAAPLFHDLLYRCAGNLPNGEMDPSDGKTFERKDVDDLFLELMTKAGIPPWKRTAAYWAVRGFAQFAWRNQT
ncbi:MAG: DUF1353 domain-containing protein [Acidobacteriota bacterium]|nr:DUF1353 domain-containing protein [Acidobacteriota bacterium]